MADNLCTSQLASPFLAAVEKPVMEPIGASLPELKADRLNPVAAPEVRQGNFLVEKTSPSSFRTAFLGAGGMK